MNFTQFVNRFPGKYKRIFFFAGKNFFVDEGVRMVRNHVDANIEFDLIRIDRPTEQQAIDALRGMPVGDNRLVIIEEPKKPESWDQAAHWISKMPKNSYVTFWTYRDDIVTKNDFFQTVIRKGFYVMCHDLSQYEGELHAWVKEELAPCDDGAVDQLVQHMGSNYGAIRMEAKKLRTVTDKFLNAQHVTALLGLPEPRDVLDLLAAIGSRDKKIALETASRIDEKNAGLGLVGLLEHRFRQLVMIHYLRSRGLEHRDIIIRMKLHRFFANQILQLSKTFTLPRCRVALSLLADIDRDLRTGHDFKHVISPFLLELLNA